MSVFPAFDCLRLHLTGAAVLVVGDAAADARRLRDAGARVRVVAETPGPALRALAASGAIELLQRGVRAEDLRGARLCLAAPEDAETAAAAEREGVLLAETAPVPARGGGRASLVGAGPGDPELLTLRAVRLLREADVVLYDALLDPAVLDLAPLQARRIDVGKRCGRHAMAQAAINKLILQHALQGSHVVRLKGGDPFIFGRGGEELDCLRAAGVPVEVVPGITAACAVAASLGIPLTHRDMARSLHLVTGHGSDGAVPDLDWRTLAKGEGTVAAYMASRTLRTVAARLIASGLPGGTPAVAVENASRPEERHLFGTLADLPDALAAGGFSGPTLVLIGQVVALAQETRARQAA